MSDDRPNVVLVVMDTARARDVLGREDVMPNLHRIAADGAAFSNVYTTAPWTLPSHASMFTGQYTSDHGTHAGAREFDPDVPTIAERLREDAYQTVAFSNNSWVSSDFGYDRGFDSFHVAWELFESDTDLVAAAKQQDGVLAQARALADQLSVRDVPSTVANALHAKFLRRRFDDGARFTNWRIKRWFDRDRDADRPFFAFVNYLEPHLEYRPPRGYRSSFLPDGVDYDEASEVNQDAWAYMAGTEPMDERDFEILRGLYRAELRYLDERIGRLYEFLRERGALENTVLLVVGDHGENIGDHGLMDHQYCLYDTLMHVPTICHAPDGVSFASGGDGLRELRDVFPTILQLARLDAPTDPTVSRRSLLDPDGRDYVVGEYVRPQPDVETLAERAGSEDADVEQFDRGLRCIRTSDWKLVEGTDGSEELYRFPAPGEEVRAPDGPEDVRERLRRTLREEHGEMDRPGETTSAPDVGDATQQRLEDLGYI